MKIPKWFIGLMMLCLALVVGKEILNLQINSIEECIRIYGSCSMLN